MRCGLLTFCCTWSGSGSGCAGCCACCCCCCRVAGTAGADSPAGLSGCAGLGCVMLARTSCAKPPPRRKAAPADAPAASDRAAPSAPAATACIHCCTPWAVRQRRAADPSARGKNAGPAQAAQKQRGRCRLQRIAGGGEGTRQSSALRPQQAHPCRGRCCSRGWAGCSASVLRQLAHRSALVAGTGGAVCCTLHRTAAAAVTASKLPYRAEMAAQAAGWALLSQSDVSKPACSCDRAELGPDRAAGNAEGVHRAKRRCEKCLLRLLHATRVGHDSSLLGPCAAQNQKLLMLKEQRQRC